MSSFTDSDSTGTASTITKPKEIREETAQEILPEIPTLIQGTQDLEFPVLSTEEDSEEAEEEVTDKGNVIHLMQRGTSKMLSVTSKGAILGRMGTEYAEFFENYEYVGRMHCEIKFLDEHWHVKDMSRNGTQINGKQVPKEEFVILKKGDLLSLANVHFEVDF